MATILDEIYSSITDFFEHYGWGVVFISIFIYFARPYVETYLKKRSLENANRPERRNLLDSEMKKARTIQQLDLYKANRDAKYANEAGKSL